MSTRGGRRVRPEIPQSVFPFVPFNLDAVLESVRRERVPDAPAGIPVGIYEQQPLACVNFRGGTPTGIALHAILNRPELPEVVLRYVFTHELLHTVVPAREIDGTLVAHPPEFFEAELRAVPVGEMSDVWSWVWGNFRPHLDRPAFAEGLHVKKGWKSSFRERVYTIDECRGTWTSSRDTGEGGFCFPSGFGMFEALAIAA